MTHSFFLSLKNFNCLHFKLWIKLFTLNCTTCLLLTSQIEELRSRLEEKNKLIEKRTHQSMMSSQDKNKLNLEMQELRDHIDIKDRKINVLQRKVSCSVREKLESKCLIKC